MIGGCIGFLVGGGIGMGVGCLVGAVVVGAEVDRLEGAILDVSDGIEDEYDGTKLGRSKGIWDGNSVGETPKVMSKLFAAGKEEDPLLLFVGR